MSFNVSWLGRTLRRGGLCLGFAAGAPFAAGAEVTATPVLTEVFDDNQKEWEVAGADWSGEFQSGVLTVRNRARQEPRFIARPLTVSLRRFPELSVDIRFPDTSRLHSAGLLWGTTAHAVDEQHFKLGSDGTYRIGRRENNQSIELAAGAVPAGYRPDGFNRLTVRVLGERTAYFINGRVVWIGPTAPLAGNFTGMVIDAGSVAEFDRFQIGYLRTDAATIAGRLAAYEKAVGQGEQVFLDEPEEGANSLTAREVKSLAGLQRADEARRARRYEEAQTAYRRLLEEQPAHGAALSGLAWTQLHLGAVAGAAETARTAVLFEPLHWEARLVLAAALAATGDATETLDQVVRDAVTLQTPATLLAAVDREHGSGRAEPLAPWVDVLRERIRQIAASTPSSFAEAVANLELAQQLQQERQHESVRRLLEQAFATVKPPEGVAAPQVWEAALWQAAGALLLQSDQPREAESYLHEAYTRLLANAGEPSAAVLRAQNVLALSALALMTADAARARELLASSLEHVLALPPAGNALKGEFLLAACNAASLTGQPAEVRGHAAKLLALRGTGQDGRYHALGHNFVGVSYVESAVPADRQAARAAFERGLRQAHAIDDRRLALDVSSNLAVSYWQAGERKRAREVYEEQVARAERAGHFTAAEAALNNLGAMLLGAEEFAAAADVFSRAIELTESARSRVSGEERIHLMASRLSAYQFLVACRQRLGDQAGLFEAANALRARNLAQAVNAQVAPPPTTLAQFQASLAADEAALFYTLQGGGEVVVQVVTRERAVSVSRAEHATLVGLKQKYLDRMSRRPGYKPVAPSVGADGRSYLARDAALHLSASDFDELVELARTLIEGSQNVPPDVRAQLMPEFLHAFSRLLVASVEPHLTARKKLIIFPDGILHFLPFEMLNEASGKPLVARFDIRYCQSASVWHTLRNRRYPEDRRSFFGMGGAIYHAMEEQAEPPRDPARMVHLQQLAERNTLAGRPQREVYAALFGPKAMSYLHGSLVEVQALARTFPDAQVFLGEEMTENRVKQLSRDGSLAQFRIVHLATHGFALPEVPELSGVAMSIFPQMQGGEDGYLTAPEIAALKMQADLAVLSACQTGLGRIYGGEGVAGLTGALLMGGANRALVSLWPVDDEGTMRFMRGIYDLSTQGVPYDEAVNQMKRRFIAGEYGERLRDPYIWAPFILYGP